MKIIELMAPAGNFESLQAAVDSGADSVYFGIDKLNMRAVSSVNFSLENLPEIVERSKERNIRTYIALNTIIYDHDISMVKQIINHASDCGVSAVIAADHAVMSYARSLGMEVHISTQVNITNLDTVRFYSSIADVMVLSRELGLNQIKKITHGIIKEDIKGPSGRLVEIEIFGHGALCMAVSGKCYLSLHTHNSSANRGACRQNCRKKYKVTDEDGIELAIDNEYIMSPKDLCTIGFLDKIFDAGARVLKIEGRGRSADYVSCVVKCYREAIDACMAGSYEPAKVSEWMNRMSEVYNRGFWNGYYLGQKLGEWTEGTSGSKASLRKVYVGAAEHYYPKIGIAQFKIESFEVKQGDSMLLIGPKTGVRKFILQNMIVKGSPADKIFKGIQFTMPLPFKVRSSDKLYKLVDNVKNQNL